MKKKVFIWCISLVLACGIAGGTVYAFYTNSSEKAEAREEKTAGPSTRYYDENVPPVKEVEAAPVSPEDLNEEQQNEKLELEYQYTDEQVPDHDVYKDKEAGTYYYNEDQLEYFSDDSVMESEYLSHLSEKEIISQEKAAELADAHMKQWYGKVMDGFVLVEQQNGRYLNFDTYEFNYQRRGGEGDFIVIEKATCRVNVYGKVFKSSINTDAARKAVTAADLAHFKKEEMDAQLIQDFIAEQGMEFYEKYKDHVEIYGYYVSADEPRVVCGYVRVGRTSYEYKYPF